MTGRGEEGGGMRFKPSESMLKRNRALQELLDLARRVISDGEISTPEAVTFQGWVDSHPEMLGFKAVDRLSRALRRIFADGHIDESERAELLDALERLAGEGSKAPTEDFGKLPTAEKDEDPAP